MTEFVGLRPNTYAYLIDDGNSVKKAKENKKMCNRTILTFTTYKNCLLNNETISESQQRFKSDAHDVYTKQNNKIVQSSNDDKRFQTFDGITSYPFGKNAGKL